MPNQRKKGKVHLGGYYDAKLKEELRRLAKQRGVSVSQVVEELLALGIEDYKRRRAGSK